MKLPQRERIFLHRPRDSALSRRAKLKIATGVYETRHKEKKKISLAPPPWHKANT